jgi:hypothetical protein
VYWTISEIIVSPRPSGFSNGIAFEDDSAILRKIRTGGRRNRSDASPMGDYRIYNAPNILRCSGSSRNHPSRDESEEKPINKSTGFDGKEIPTPPCFFDGCFAVVPVFVVSSWFGTHQLSTSHATM